MTPAERGEGHGLEVVELATGKVVHVVEVAAGATERTLARVAQGMLINMDRERFYVREKARTALAKCGKE